MGEGRVTMVNMKRALVDRVAEIKRDLGKRARGEVVHTHVPTGLRSFDTRFGGLEIGVNTLIVAHSGEGKTSLLAQLAKGAAQSGLGAFLVLLEDPLARAMDRVLAEILGESANDLARLKFRGDQARLDAAVESADWAERVGVMVGQYSPEQVLAALPTTIGGARVGFWGTDYAQGFSDEEQNMEQVCARMARAQHRIALDRGIACALGSQTTAKCLERGRARWERTLAQSGGDVTRADVGGFRPGRGDIMWSQRLGQYSKAVWYLFRPGRWRRELGDHGAKDDVMEINVGKANFGPEGSETFSWHGPTCAISDRGTK